MTEQDPKAPRKLPPLFEVAVFAELLKAGNEEDQIRYFDRMLDHLVEKFGLEAHRDDVVQEARIKLWLALRKKNFDPKRGTSFAYFYTTALNSVRTSATRILRDAELATGEYGFRCLAEGEDDAAEYLGVASDLDIERETAARQLIERARFRPRLVPPIEACACYWLQDNLALFVEGLGSEITPAIMAIFRISKRRARAIADYTLATVRGRIQEARTDG